MTYFSNITKIHQFIISITILCFSIAQALTNQTPPNVPNTCLNTDATDSNKATSNSPTIKSTKETDLTESMKRTMAPLARLIPNEKLFVSEPNPAWFGNGANTPDDPAWTNSNWLKSRFHFSFAEYNNHRNSHFGILRVMNDDLVQPHRGFGTHPHRNMEIITYIVHGELAHEDSMGNGESLGRGSIQFMTAGTGITHSEFNHGDEPLRFIQTWIVPRQSGLKPSYGSYNAGQDCDGKKNILQHLASDVDRTDIETPVKIAQDVNCYAAELEMNKSTRVELGEKRQAYMLCVEGELEVNGTTLKKHDAMEIHGGEDKTSLEIKATGVEETENGNVAHFLMFDMPFVPGSGRSDM
ncbi:pirin-like protein [Nitzschia inconspicua]|uniref:Pirin-like protein n=1 Tax=Nitzschia inconspicua TaxID=303405 RepID=A0A9K3PJH4_9STRA|nr:pirin-like protein [Nitzschia inconspicua]